MRSGVYAVWKSRYIHCFQTQSIILLSYRFNEYKTEQIRAEKIGVVFHI